jgi:hypothetical protein
MAMTTAHWTKNVSRQVFLPAYMAREGVYSWPWEKLYTVANSDHATEQVFAYSGMGAAQATAELEPAYFADMSELEETTFTHSKYTLGFMASQELVEDGKYVDVIKDGGEAVADGLNYIVDYSTCNLVFNRAFSSTYPLYDGTELCGAHTLASGATLTNEGTAASISFDSLWLGINYFENTATRQDGLPLVDKPKYLLYNPVKEKLVAKVLSNTTGHQPDSADQGNTDTLKGYGITGIPCRHLSTNYWFLLGERAMKDLRFFWRIRREVKRDSDFDRDGLKIKARIRFSVGVADSPRIFGNTGA